MYDDGVSFNKFIDFYPRNIWKDMIENLLIYWKSFFFPIIFHRVGVNSLFFKSIFSYIIIYNHHSFFILKTIFRKCKKKKTLRLKHKINRSAK
jgi:hypothetical protein